MAVKSTFKSRPKGMQGAAAANPNANNLKNSMKSQIRDRQRMVARGAGKNPMLTNTGGPRASGSNGRAVPSGSNTAGVRRRI